MLYQADWSQDDGWKHDEGWTRGNRTWTSGSKGEGQLISPPDLQLDGDYAVEVEIQLTQFLLQTKNFASFSIRVGLDNNPKSGGGYACSIDAANETNSSDATVYPDREIVDISSYELGTSLHTYRIEVRQKNSLVFLVDGKKLITKMEIKDKISGYMAIEATRSNITVSSFRVVSLEV